MLVICPICETSYRLTEAPDGRRRFLVKCTYCGQIFSAVRPVRVEEVPFLDLAAAEAFRPDGRMIAVSNQKGGVAKTTTCLNLGVSLALRRARVLLVDFDGQANLSISLGYPGQWSFYEAVQSPDRPLETFILPTRYPGVSLLPSSRNMVLLNKKYFGARRFEYLLRDRLRTVRERFDYIIVDTPPSIEFFTLNALSACGTAIIPSHCDYLSTHGVDQILKLIELIRRKTNPALEARILLTMFDRHSTAARVVRGKLAQLYAGRTFRTVIEMDPKVREAQILTLPVIHYDKHSPAGLQYATLAQEMTGALRAAA